jgi:hypothetical protein
VDRNPDEPTLSTNSPRTHYALSEAALLAIQQYNTPEWSVAVASFLSAQQTLIDLYERRRQQTLIPLRYQGQDYHLSPGLHNTLQVAIVESFGPRFAPGAKVLYLGDTANKTLILDTDAFNALNIPITQHDKLPDVILYDEARHWLFLVEAVTSHGPVSPKRYLELTALVANCPAGVVYVSAFPDFPTFRNFVSEIAWETEVWVAEMAEHLIHFNGDRFLGPHAP